MCYMPSGWHVSPKLASRTDSNETIFAADAQPNKSTLVMRNSFELLQPAGWQHGPPDRKPTPPNP